RPLVTAAMRAANFMAVVLSCSAGLFHTRRERFIGGALVGEPVVRHSLRSGRMRVSAAVSGKSGNWIGSIISVGQRLLLIGINCFIAGLVLPRRGANPGANMPAHTVSCHAAGRISGSFPLPSCIIKVVVPAPIASYINDLAWLPSPN